MLNRIAEALLQEKTKYFPVVAITGPRQSGKSTLAKLIFKEKPYISLEDPDNRQFAIDDPRAFLAQFTEGAILDEVQNCPELFSYLQTLVDSHRKTGLFVLTGSQQFGLNAKITQSLAGRVGFLQLLPFSYRELIAGKKAYINLEEMLFTGSYPSIYDRNIPPSMWYADYVMTYVERDVRQLLNVQDLRTFHRFLQMCAVRTGQLLNLSNLANDCGITHNTAKSWISVLEASYILFLLSPHNRNFNKRLIKAPKLYFYDTGLACFLSKIKNKEQLITHPMRGALFETWVLSEFVKDRFNRGIMLNLYFWRDSQGHEVDIIVEDGEALIPIEVKAGQTIKSQHFEEIKYWQQLTNQTNPGWLIYAGNESQNRTSVNIICWQEIDRMIAKTSE